MMLNANSGMVDMLKPANSGSGAGKRQDAAANDTPDGSRPFGDTLKGQMERTAESRRAVADHAKNAADKQKDKQEQADASGREGETAAAADAPHDKAPATKAGAVKAAKEELGDDTAPSQAVAAAVVPMAEPTAKSVLGLTPPQPAAGSEGQAPAVAAAGKELPTTAPLLAAIATEAGRAAGAVAGDNTEPPGKLAASNALQASSAETPELSVDFLKGVQAAVAELNGKETKSADRLGKGQATDAVFKLLGGAIGKETPMQVVTPAMHTTANGATATATTPAATPASVDVPVRQQGWDHAVAERVVWMARQGLQQAEIQLHPKNMGPIEVHVSVDKDQAKVAFIAHHAVTREALEAALPKLRDMLQDSGLNLAQSHVSQHSAGQQQQQGMGFAGQHGGGRTAAGADVDSADAVVAETVLNGNGGLGAVDYYA